MALDNRLVSIIMPVYNKEKYIAQSIESVLSQSYGEWELLIVDDCSSDRSEEIIENYSRFDGRIHYERLDRNGGASRARNAALVKARGRYVAFLDADDVWRPMKLQKQLHLLEASRAGFCFTAIEMIDEDGHQVKSKRKIRPVVDYRYLLTNTVIPCSSVLIDRSATGDFRMPEIPKGQDYATWLSILKKGQLAFGIDEALVLYRLVKDSVSANKLSALRRTWRIYRKSEHLGLLKSIYCFSLYTLHAFKKYFF
ncbi:MAG TPA: glycosyltransferase family 2 protein [Clostridia bacterium]|nr:glycosyltransferase family 2 protein [Clostridia bacterium]